jgi:hypothetical protein
MLRKLLPPLAAALLLGGAPAFAQISDGAIIANKAPPQSPVDTPNQTREGYLWAPGYYTWRNDDYVWVEGRWERERPGYRYVAPRWVEYDGRYRFVEESWAVDGNRTDGNRNDDSSRGR